MSNTNNKSLNDLLSSVQADAKGDILSQSEVERLLPSIERSVPVTQSIGQRLAQRLLSTPLKMGMTAATAAACVTLGIIVALPQTSMQTATGNFTHSQPTYRSNETDVKTQSISQPPAKNSPFANRRAQMAAVLPFTAEVPSPPAPTPDSIHLIGLNPLPLVQAEGVKPIRKIENVPILSSDTTIQTLDSIVKMSDPPYKESWYAGYLMVGANQIINPFTATLPALDIINGIHIGHYEAIGLLIGFRFVDPIIVAKYVQVELGMDSHTFWGDGAIRPFFWAQASSASEPFSGQFNGFTLPFGNHLPGFGGYGISLGAGPGVQFRTAPGFSLMLDAGYQTNIGPYGAYTLHFGIGF
jgi:hypothetical protein